MTITNHNEGKLITLSKAFDSRAKLLNLFYAFIFGCCATGAAYFLKQGIVHDLPTNGNIVCLFATAAFMIACIRFLKKALLSEKILVTAESFTLIQSGMSHTSHCYKNEFISGLKHLQKPELSKHPLAGESFDYLGFQTEQAVINDMHGDKRIQFDYQGTPVHFGEDVYSWDFDELVRTCIEVSGRDFTEKTEEQSIISVPPGSEV